MTTNPQLSSQTALANLEHELSHINDLDLRQFTSEMILHAPGSYWYRPAATHSGHHPDDEHGNWGNLIHVKRVFMASQPLVEAEDFSSGDSDIVYSADLLHDIGKYGVSGEMPETNPLHAVNFTAIVEVHYVQLEGPLVEVFRRVLESDPYFEIKMAIACHAGRWGRFPPVTRTAKIVHYADMVASRIALPVDIKVPY